MMRQSIRAVNENFVHIWDWESRKAIRFVRVDFESYFCTLEGDSVEYYLRGEHNDFVCKLQICDISRQAKVDAWIAAHRVFHSPIDDIIEQNREKWTALPRCSVNI